MKTINCKIDWGFDELAEFCNQITKLSKNTELNVSSHFLNKFEEFSKALFFFAASLDVAIQQKDRVHKSLRSRIRRRLSEMAVILCRRLEQSCGRSFSNLNPLGGNIQKYIMRHTMKSVDYSSLKFGVHQLGSLHSDYQIYLSKWQERNGSKVFSHVGDGSIGIAFVNSVTSEFISGVHAPGVSVKRLFEVYSLKKLNISPSSVELCHSPNQKRLSFYTHKEDETIEDCATAPPAKAVSAKQETNFRKVLVETSSDELVLLDGESLITIDSSGQGLLDARPYNLSEFLGHNQEELDHMQQLLIDVVMKNAEYQTMLADCESRLAVCVNAQKSEANHMETLRNTVSLQDNEITALKQSLAAKSHLLTDLRLELVAIATRNNETLKANKEVCVQLTRELAAQKILLKDMVTQQARRLGVDSQQGNHDAMQGYSFALLSAFEHAYNRTHSLIFLGLEHSDELRQQSEHNRCLLGEYRSSPRDVPLIVNSQTQTPTKMERIVETCVDTQITEGAEKSRYYAVSKHGEKLGSLRGSNNALVEKARISEALGEIFAETDHNLAKIVGKQRSNLALGRSFCDVWSRKHTDHLLRANVCHTCTKPLHTRRINVKPYFRDVIVNRKNGRIGMKVLCQNKYRSAEALSEVDDNTRCAGLSKAVDSVVEGLNRIETANQTIRPTFSFTSKVLHTVAAAAESFASTSSVSLIRGKYEKSNMNAQRTTVGLLQLYGKNPQQNDSLGAKKRIDKAAQASYSQNYLRVHEIDDVTHQYRTNLNVITKKVSGLGSRGVHR